MTTSPLLEMSDVTRAFTVRQGLFVGSPFTVRAVNGVDLRLFTGETLGLVGESGCGKSTLARMAVGLDAPTSGTIRLDNREMAAWSPREKACRVQMVFQDPFASLDPRMKVGNSIAEPLLVSREHVGAHSRAEVRKTVEALLERVGLSAAYYSRYPHEFSGGQRQRLAVARALISGARLMVLDEAVSAQDASVQAQVLNLLKDLQEEHQLTYLFISHDLGVVGFMSDRIAVMYLGKIVELADKDTLLKAPSHPYTVALLGAAPVRDPLHRRTRVPLAGELPSPLSPPPGCAFHPRCPRAQEICRQAMPNLVERGDRHFIRCHFPC